MRKWRERLAAWLLVLVLTVVLVPNRGQAVLSGVYITAVNDRLLDLTSETMPFWSGGVLYVSNAFFEGRDLGVNFVRNTSMELAMLYTNRTDLRFDLEKKNAYDKQGNTYDVRAIEKSGNVFFPLDMVCNYFGLSWSYNETETVPLIRVTSDSVALNDVDFIDAAASQMRSYYAAYEKLVKEQQAHQSNNFPPVHAAAGQKIHLIVDSTGAGETKKVMEALGKEEQWKAKATFLLTAEQMADGDLLRGIVAEGHAVALRVTGETREEIREEIQRGRELLWKTSCAWLDLVFCQGEVELDALLEELGCRRVTAALDESKQGLASANRAKNLLWAISRHREDLGVLLGSDSGCLEGLPTLVEGLKTAQYSVAAWRLTA